MKIKLVAIVPVAIVFVALIVLYITAYPEGTSTHIYEIPSPFSAAHSIFLSVSALVVAYFFARAFLSTGSLDMLALGSGSLILGSGFLLSQVLGSVPFGGAVQLVGISTLVFLLSSLFYGAFAFVSITGRSPGLPKPTTPLVVSYAFGSIMVLVFVWAVEAGAAPAFFTPGVGPTLLREEVFIVAIVLFLLSALAVMRSYLTTGSPVLFWFSLGLVLVAIGFTSALSGRFPGGLFSWLGRLSVAVGGIYFLAAVAAAYRRNRKPDSDEM